MNWYFVSIVFFYSFLHSTCDRWSRLLLLLLLFILSFKFQERKKKTNFQQFIHLRCISIIKIVCTAHRDAHCLRINAGTQHNAFFCMIKHTHITQHSKNEEKNIYWNKKRKINEREWNNPANRIVCIQEMSVCFFLYSQWNYFRKMPNVKIKGSLHTHKKNISLTSS